MNYPSRTHSKAKEHKSKMHLVHPCTRPGRVRVKYQSLPRKHLVLGRKEQRAEQTLQPAAGQKHHQSSQNWGKGCTSTSQHTPCSNTKASPKKRVTRPATKIHSDPSASSTCKWPREGVWMGQDLDVSCSSCACPGCSRGEHRALISHKLN